MNDQMHVDAVKLELHKGEKPVWGEQLVCVCAYQIFVGEKLRIYQFFPGGKSGIY